MTIKFTESMLRKDHTRSRESHERATAMFMQLLSGKSYLEIASDVGLAQSRIRQIVSKAMSIVMQYGIRAQDGCFDDWCVFIRSERTLKQFRADKLLWETRISRYRTYWEMYDAELQARKK